MKLDLDNKNIFQMEMTMQDVKNFTDLFDEADVDDAMLERFDEVQDYVHQHEKEAYIVIKVTK